MAQENFTPQLIMETDLAHFDETQEINLGEGYTVRAFCDSEDKSDEQAWNRVIAESFGDPTCTFEALMRPDPQYKPERIWFVCFNGEPIATAAGWFETEHNMGVLHMVGALKGYSGKGVGAAVVKAAMKSMKAEGRGIVMLKTDDFRLPAVKTYLRLGWRPKIVAENQYDRWKNLYQQLGWQETPPTKNE